MNIALILAGGFGSRMGQDIPKQFIHVNNRPILIYTLEAFQRHPQIDQIHVVCVEGWEAILRGYALQFNITKLSGIVTGGVTRFDSTRRGMEALRDVQDEDVIIVHDGVRPLVTAESITDTISKCRKHGASMSVRDCVDTMYLRTEDEYTAEDEDRTRIVSGQTPEAVSGKGMREMYELSDAKKIRNDSISALQVMLGKRIYFSRGDERNIKLTRVEDIELFKALLVMQKDEWLK